jgi:hypothetical protein
MTMFETNPIYDAKNPRIWKQIYTKLASTDESKNSTQSSQDSHDSHQLKALHGELKLEFAEILEDWQNKYNLSPALSKLFSGLLRFVDNDDTTRVFALGNELAESLAPSLRNYSKLFGDLAYYGLWTLTGVYSAGRMLMSGLVSKSLSSAIKLFTSDLIAAITAPTLAIRALNTVQNKIFQFIKTPKIAEDIAKPLISFGMAYLVVHKLDNLVPEFLEKNLFGKLLSKKNSEKLDQWAKKFFGSIFNPSLKFN